MLSIREPAIPCPNLHFLFAFPYKYMTSAYISHLSRNFICYFLTHQHISYSSSIAAFSFRNFVILRTMVLLGCLNIQKHWTQNICVLLVDLDRINKTLNISALRKAVQGDSFTVNHYLFDSLRPTMNNEIMLAAFWLGDAIHRVRFPFIHLQGWATFIRIRPYT